MRKSSPYYLFSPESPGSIGRRLNDGERILPEDLVPIVKSDPSCLNDPLVCEYVVRALKGELRPRRGRKATRPGRVYQIAIADVLVEDRAKEIRALRKHGTFKRSRGDVGPAEQAAEEIARMLKLGTGRSLANEISAQKTKSIHMRATPLAI